VSPDFAKAAQEITDRQEFQKSVSVWLVWWEAPEGSNGSWVKKGQVASQRPAVCSIAQNLELDRSSVFDKVYVIT
jgi:hypothetical protein